MIRSQRKVKYTRGILKRKNSIFVGNWISIKMKCFVKFQFLVRFYFSSFIIFVYTDDDSKILRNMSLIS
jgi:hypothetical protein